jgi:DnaD/phage-associated family protein
MKSFVLHGDGQSDHTLVSNVFLDKYMPSANGEYVKIYLYLLRCLKSDSQELSIPVIADRFDHTESDVRRALKYWEKMKLLQLEYDGSKSLTGVRLLESGSTPEEPGRTEPQDNREYTAIARSPLFSAPQAAVKPPLSQEEIRQLLFICEQYLGKTLSSSEIDRIMYFHDTLGFSAELIEYLVEYCVSKRHKSLRYIESVALGWHEEGYTTVAQAKQQTNTYNKAYFSILKAFGITNRNPVDVEISYMNRWMKEYGFSTELITEACSRTMAAIHQPSFEYADKILVGWRENGVSSPSDLEALDSRHRSSRVKPKEEASVRRTAAAPNRFHNFKERDYDFKELEKQLIKN